MLNYGEMGRVGVTAGWEQTGRWPGVATSSAQPSLNGTGQQARGKKHPHNVAVPLRVGGVGSPATDGPTPYAPMDALNEGHSQTTMGEN